MQDKVAADLKQAMLARDHVAVNVLKSLKAALQNETIAQGGSLSEADEMKIVKREAKKRQEAIDIYSKANRHDKVVDEQAELAVLSAYMPEQLDEQTLITEVEQAVEKLGATQPSDTGKVMGYLSQKLAGRADNKRLSELVRQRLSGDNQ